MEGPYRDLGSGFARLTGIEGARRGPSYIHSVEDAFLEMLRNARDAGARNIYVASALRARRYRTLTVLDDGHGIPEPYKDLIFEPGVTNRHLQSESAKSTSIESGLSLYHIKNIALQAKVLSTTRPTSIRVTFDTRRMPERALQSETRPSLSNLPGTVRSFLANTSSTLNPAIYYGSPSAMMATALKNRIIQTNETTDARLLVEEGERLGISVSTRTVQRILHGEIKAVDRLTQDMGGGGVLKGDKQSFPDANSTERPFLELNREEISRIATILGDAARTRYLAVGDLNVESRPGEIVVRSPIYEPEEEYE